MNIDFYNEIRWELNNFYSFFKKKHITQADTQQMILIMDHIILLLELYLYDYLD